MNLTLSSFAEILVVIGLLALLISIIIEVTKNIVTLSKKLTNKLIISLSITLTTLAYFAYVSHYNTTIKWYCIIFAMLLGFVVAYVVMYGWDKLAELYKKFRNIPTKDFIDNNNPGSNLNTPSNIPDSSTDEQTNTLLEAAPPTDISDNDNSTNDSSDTDTH